MSSTNQPSTKIDWDALPWETEVAGAVPRKDGVELIIGRERRLLRPQAAYDLGELLIKTAVIVMGDDAPARRMS